MTQKKRPIPKTRTEDTPIIKCQYCEFRCAIPEHMTGRCNMYQHEQGKIIERYPDRYLNIYPVTSESIPLLHFYPNSRFLLISTIGCNFACEGCISEFQTSDTSNISSTLVTHTPTGIVEIAREGGCIGIAFCLNEPTVSFPTFIRVAQAAKDAGLLVGCSSNGYMTKEAVNMLIPLLDHINIGLKGYSDARYQECKVPTSSPVFRNIQAFHDAGVAVEISIMYLNGREDEVIQAAERVQSVSPDIPLQVMRFMATDRERLGYLEPDREQGEELCIELKKLLHHVYLFNTAATSMLDSVCPVCGAVIIHRVFFGPMAARVLSSTADGICACGYRLPFTGEITPVKGGESEILGGYRSIMGVRFIAEILGILGITDKEDIDRYCTTAISSGYLHSIQQQESTPEAYCRMVEYLAHLSGREDEGTRFIQYIRSVIQEIKDRATGANKPRVINVLSHPLSPLYAEKFENTLVEIAEGRSLNREINYNEKEHAEYSSKSFTSLDPEIILISAHFQTPVHEFIDTCRKVGITAQALENNQVYSLTKRYVPTSPFWIIGLMEIAIIIHPDLFDYSLTEEEERLRSLFDSFITDSSGKNSGQGQADAP